MYFYIKLASIEDDQKLEGIVLFEDSDNPLTLGEGAQEYWYDFDDECYVDRVDEIEEIVEKIADILPNARICYVSMEDEGSGETDTILKKENNSQIYRCGALFGKKFPFGSDEWCEQVIRQSEECFDEMMEDWDE